MKKGIDTILIAILIIACPLTVFGADLDTGDKNSEGIYISSETVPDEVYTYAEENIGWILRDLYPLNTLSVGQPFAIDSHTDELYYFLVYSDGDLVGFYRVFTDEDGKYSGIFSEEIEIVEGFKELENTTNTDNPAKIMVGKYEDIYAVTQNKVSTILSDYQGRSTSDVGQNYIVSMSKGMTTIVNAKEPINFSMPLAARTAYSKYLNVKIVETQGSEPWCAAYVTATICRHIKNDSTIKAQKVMEHAYPGTSLTSLKKKSLSRDQVVAYGKYKGLSPSRTGILSGLTVKLEMNNNSPIYFGCKNTANSDDRHAILCRGYDTTGSKSYYSIWNPWYTSFEKMDALNNLYTTPSGTKYKQECTIYGWRNY